jgi:protein O-GlcNAc transferase
VTTSSSSQLELAEGYTLQQQGRLPEAAATFRRLLKSEPRNSNALHLLGVTLARMGQVEDAARHMAAAVELQPANPAMRINLGNALSELGRYQEAVAR